MLRGDAHDGRIRCAVPFRRRRWGYLCAGRGSPRERHLILNARHARDELVLREWRVSILQVHALLDRVDALDGGSKAFVSHGLAALHPRHALADRRLEVGDGAGESGADRGELLVDARLQCRSGAVDADAATRGGARAQLRASAADAAAHLITSVTAAAA